MFNYKYYYYMAQNKQLLSILGVKQAKQAKKLQGEILSIFLNTSARPLLPPPPEKLFDLSKYQNVRCRRVEQVRL